MSKRTEPSRIEGKITCADGEVVEFSIGNYPDTRWTQWGNTESVLFRTNGMVEAMSDAAREHLVDMDDDTDEETP